MFRKSVKSIFFHYLIPDFGNERPGTRKQNCITKKAPENIMTTFLRGILCLYSNLSHGFVINFSCKNVIYKLRCRYKCFLHCCCTFVVFSFALPRIKITPRPGTQQNSGNIYHSYGKPETNWPRTNRPADVGGALHADLKLKSDMGYPMVLTLLCTENVFF